eukprot:6053975-Pleurochrysis_carterae.AAC.3
MGGEHSRSGSKATEWGDRARLTKVAVRCFRLAVPPRGDYSRPPVIRMLYINTERRMHVMGLKLDI